MAFAADMEIPPRRNRRGTQRRIGHPAGKERLPPCADLGFARRRRLVRRIGNRRLGRFGYRLVKHLVADKARILPDRGLDLLGKSCVLTKEVLRVLAALADPLAVIGNPAPDFDNAGGHTKVEKPPIFEMPSPYMMSNSMVRNGAATLFFTTSTRVWLPITVASLIAPIRRISRRTDA